MRIFVPYLVAINLTYRCNLNCAHCYMDAQQRAQPEEGELSCAELSSLFVDIARNAPGTIIVLTGGEPLMHPQIEEIVHCGVQAGLRIVLGTNGVLLNEPRIKRVQKLGLSGVGISLDSVNAAQHDSFRGVPGSFARSCDAIRFCKEHGLHVQVHFTVTRENFQELEGVVALGRELGASIVNFFFLVCVGRGQNLLDLSPELYETTLQEIARLQRESKGIMVQARCAPHFKRILFDNDPASPYTRATGYDGGGCLAGTHYCRITPKGDVTPCPYMELSAGNIRTTPFWQIWEDAQPFNTLRHPQLSGRCAECEYKLLCGGCRARSLVDIGDLMGEDPSCAYLPQGGAKIAAFTAAASCKEKVQWTPGARERLKRIPLFLRNYIKKRVEERALSEGVWVTEELMRKYREEREKDLGMKFK